MTNKGRFTVLLLLAGAICAVFVMKNRGGVHGIGRAAGAQGLPRLIDFGKGICIPCKLMMPVLKELKKEMKGKVSIEYVDIGKDRDASDKFKIKAIPTQVFLDAKGKELFRHIGFFSKTRILEKWKELGYPFTGESERR